MGRQELTSLVLIAVLDPCWQDKLPLGVDAPLHIEAVDEKGRLQRGRFASHHRQTKVRDHEKVGGGGTKQMQSTVIVVHQLLGNRGNRTIRPKAKLRVFEPGTMTSACPS